MPLREPVVGKFERVGKCCKRIIETDLPLKVLFQPNEMTYVSVIRGV